MKETMTSWGILLPKLLSTKFWLCFLVIIGGLIRGGPEGFAATTIALGYYCGTKAYQNVQFAKNGKK